MKKFLFSAIAAVLFAVSLSACGGAQAATLTKVFTDTNGTVFDINPVRRFSQNASNVVVTLKDGSTNLNFADASGVLYTKLTTSAAIAGSFANIYNTTIWINLDQVRKITCDSVAGTMSVQWADGLPATSSFSDPGCIVYNQIISNGN